MTAMTLSTYCSQISFVFASTITRMSGSVPLSRTRIRPSFPSASVAAATAAFTFGFSLAACLSATRTFFRTCG